MFLGNNGRLSIAAAPHVQTTLTTPKIMLLVAVALIPAFLVSIYFYGMGIIWQFIICLISGSAAEIICAKLRHRSWSYYLSDYSAAVTAALLALTLPPLMPWYLTAGGMLFAILLVKQIFGGMGMNIFNPAMAGFIFLVISAPGAFFNTWVTPAPNAPIVVSSSTAAHVIFSDANPADLQLQMKQQAQMTDVISGATMLESVKTARKSGQTQHISNPDFTQGSFSAYLAMAAACILGGLLLIAFKIIPWEMPCVFLAGVIITALIWHALDSEASISMPEHLLLGGTMLGAFFIITDPVTNSGTRRGRIVYAAFTAFLLILLRVQGSYADAMAFAVLLGNAAAPLIDVLTKRRPFGIGYKKGGLQ